VEHSVRTLFVDDQIKLYEADISSLSKGLGYDLNCTSFGVDAITRAKEVDVLILDLEYPGQEGEIASKLGITSSLKGPEAGMAILEHYHRHYPDVGVIVVTQNPSYEAVGRCFQLGAIQYLDKDRKGGLDCVQLAQEIKNAVELVQERNAKRVFETSGDAGDDFITRSPQLRGILKEAAKLARQRISILLLGESGVGKERLARFIHRFSDRSQKAFVAVNVGVLQKELLGSELFGHVKGAYTGAHADKPGLFKTADKGTIFLDEIAEASEEVQVGLLRVLQEGEIRPVGSNQSEKIDVRVIAATNRDLEGRVRVGDFREDLYYRLAKATLTIPPLRERPEDIPALAHHFLKRFCIAGGLPLKDLLPGAIEALCSNGWVGNVRELEGVIEHTVALTPQLTIGEEDLTLPSNKPLGRWNTLVDELAVSLKDGDGTARRFMNDLELLVYNRLYNLLGTHSKVAKIWGKEDEALTAQRQRWGEALAKEVFAGQRTEEQVPPFLKDVCDKYLQKLKKSSTKNEMQ
jgi:DNA-binding NtrC family response regulator